MGFMGIQASIGRVIRQCICNVVMVMGDIQSFMLYLQVTGAECTRCKTGGQPGFRFCPECGERIQRNTQGITSPRIREIDVRLQEMDFRFSQRQYEKKKCALAERMEAFFRETGTSMAQATPRDVRRFLVERESAGRTVKHDVKCPLLGSDKSECACPRGMALGTVKSLVGQMRALFCQEGRGEFWDTVKKQGNPAAASDIKKHVKCVGDEMAVGHVTPKQARPIFMDKLRCMTQYLTEELGFGDLSLKKTFVYLRDRAFFLVQFFTGGRCGDLAEILVQDIRKLQGEEGLVIRQTMGKTLRGGHAQNVFLMRNPDEAICPVRAVENYMIGVKDMGVNLDAGYVFRQVTGQGYVLESPVGYQEMYDHLKTYLKKLHLWEGETPHGLRGGAAITLLLTGAAQSNSDIMAHGGWKSGDIARYYSREGDFRQKTKVASALTTVTAAEAKLSPADNVGSTFKECDFTSLPGAFP